MTHRRLVVAIAIAVVVTAAFLSGSGVGSSASAARGAPGIPYGLAAAIHDRLGARTLGGPLLGFSVALSADGTTALVGAPYARHYKGAVYVFHVAAAGSWSSNGTPTAALTDSLAIGFGLGVALSADGTTAFVRSPDTGAPDAIDVFHVSAEDGWASSSKPTATLTVGKRRAVGTALAVSPDGTTLVAGAPGYHNLKGGGFVFHVAGEGAWASASAPTATLTNAGAPTGDYLVGGGRVAISGDGSTVLLSDDQNPTGGGAYLYHASAEDAWTSSTTPTAILTDAALPSPDYALGHDLVLSGDGTVALLAAANAVDVFHVSGEGAWASTSTPTATLDDGGLANIFGFGVDLSTDGTTALVTAPGFELNRGSADIFRVAGEGAWASSSAPMATLTNSGGHHGSLLGLGSPALSADGATALVGNPSVGIGAVEVFHASDATSWASSSTPTAILTVSALKPCVVPRLIGLTASAAKSALRRRYCRLGTVGRVSSTATKGRVVSQSRRSGSHLAHGTKVNIKLAK